MFHLLSPPSTELHWRDIERGVAGDSHKTCFPGHDAATLDPLHNLGGSRRYVTKKDCLYRSGEQFAALFVVRTGTFKTLIATESDPDQIVAFYVSGDIMGIEGILGRYYQRDAVALEDSEVSTIAFGDLGELAYDRPPGLENLYRYMATEIHRLQETILRLGSMTGEGRLASFLLDLASRYHARGYSRSEFRLQMSRKEIGSYLGLELETVSRLFSRLERKGLLQTKGRTVKLLDFPELEHLTTKHC